MAYAITHTDMARENSQSRLADGAGRLRRLIAFWRQRARQRAELAQMTDLELHDIGLNHGDVDAEINKPFWRG